MKSIIHCTLKFSALGKRRCLFAFANDPCLYIYELISSEIHSTYPCFKCTAKSKSQIAFSVSTSSRISSIFFIAGSAVAYCLQEWISSTSHWWPV